MSNPYDPSRPSDGDGWSEPSYGQQPPPGRYGQQDQTRYVPTQPQYGQPQYDQPQYGQPQYGQPQYDQPQYGQPLYGQPLPIGVPPTAPKGRARGIIAGVAAVVVIGGGIGTYVAFSSSSAAGGGASDPKAAVQTLVTDVDNSDLIGLLDDLAPGERDAIATPFEAQFSALKKNGVIDSGASASHLAGVQVTASDIKYGKVRTVNDHVKIVRIIGGTIHVAADATRLPFTKRFLKLISDGQMSGQTKLDRTIDISTVLQRSGKPVEIATQEVGGRWYPSLFYTVADYATMAAHLTTPTTSIPAVGASSADDAVRSELEDLLGGKVEEAIELTSPDELAVLHDYGSLIVSRAHYDPAPVTLDEIRFTDAAIDGGTRVTLKSAELTIDGHQASISIAHNCVHLTTEGHTRDICAQTAISELEIGGRSLTDAQQRAVTDLFSAVSSVGIDTTESGGQWYVNPVRSYFDLSGEILDSLKTGDVTALFELFRR